MTILVSYVSFGRPKAPSLAWGLQFRRWVGFGRCMFKGMGCVGFSDSLNISSMCACAPSFPGTKEPEPSI